MSIHRFNSNLETWQWGRVSNEEIGAPIEDNSTTKDDILKELNLEEEGTTEEEGTGEDEEETVGEITEGEEEEETEEEIKLDEEEDEEKLVVPVKKQEILKKYPTLEKEFPALFAYYYKAQQYTDLLPTIADAREAVKNSETLNNFRKDLEAGDNVKIIAAIKEYSPENYPKFVDNYLATLAAVDKEAYLHVSHNVLANAIQFSLSKAKEEDNEELRDAALIINEFLFGSKTPQEVTRLSKTEDNSESKKLQKDREDFENQKLQDAQNELKGRIDNQITSTVDANIDKDNRMTVFVKRNAVREVKDQLDKALKEDKPFQRVIDSLFKKAKADKFSRTALDKIKTAHLTQAKTYLQRIIPKVRAEALKGNTVQKKETIKHRLPAGSEVEKNSGNRQNNGQTKKKMSTLDILNS